jgi:hypothetical protein
VRKWAEANYGDATEVGPLVQPIITMPDPNDPDRILVEMATEDSRRIRLVFSKFAFNSIATGKGYP